MRKLNLILLFTVLAFSLSAQKHITEFLGIPVDGYKPEMIKKLKAKGFSGDSYSDVLFGEFNGEDVGISIKTNNNKVWRIMVVGVYGESETDIKIKFNSLCRQFQNNKRYIPAPRSNYILPEDEDISYGMLVDKKRYQAAYLQLPTDVDSVSFQEEILSILLSKYTEEEISETTVKVAWDILNYDLEKYSKNSVWFMIHQISGKYYINLFYDNEYNMPNGEDL